MKTKPYSMVLGVPWLYIKKEPIQAEHRQYRRNCTWTEEMDELLAREYPTKPTEDVARAVGLSEKAVRNRASKLGIKKSHDVWLTSVKKGMGKNQWMENFKS